MKAFLMHRDRDFDLDAPLPPNSNALTQDLELSTLFSAMALGDKYLYEVASKAVLQSLRDGDEIKYRQDILRDVIANPTIVRFLYQLTIESGEKEKKTYIGIMGRSPGAVLSRSVEVLQIFVAILKQLRGIGTYNVHRFSSEGFIRFFAMLDKELDDDYFATIQNHLKRLKLPGGVLVSAELGKGNKGANYTLRKANDEGERWWARLMGPKPESYTLHLAPRDESGAAALGELRDRGINLVANALGQSNDHILSFFRMLRSELAFYIGCLNLHEQLTKKGEPIAFPVPMAVDDRKLTFAGLCDVCLTLRIDHRVVGNDLNADGKDFVVITGANQGGKTTFLRSIGLSQLMMQCGMFVTAVSFSANSCSNIFTHYKREEDVTMESGKLDEELSRLNEIVDYMSPNAILLFNESFAATNEREGSEIARQITSALLEKRIKVFFVTHLYDFAHGAYEKNTASSIFLRAERQADGERTFKVIEGEPLQTGYGEDLYNEIFGATKVVAKQKSAVPVGQDS
jgi:hypothetical protein